MSEPARRWELILTRQAEKVLHRLPRDLLRRMDRAILGLANDPRPPGCVKLAGYDNLWRVRVGDWRIIYAIEAERLVIVVVDISPRGSAYRRL